MNYVSCTDKEATHVRILSEDLEGIPLTFGGVYEYLYDEDPFEQTHFVIQDDGIPFYDFECVVRVEYLRKTLV